MDRMMRTTDDLLAAAVEAAPLLIVDARGRIVMSTHGCASMFGATPEELQGRAVDDLAPGFDLDATLAAGESAWNGRDANGRVFPLKVWVSPPRGDPDHAWVALWMVDVSVAYAAEALSRDLQDQLARVWRINSLGEMAASLAHELNQPLAAAAAYLHTAQTNLARHGLPDDEAGRNVSLAKSQLLRAGAIVRRLREQLTPEARAFEVERASLMISDMGGILAMIERDGGVTLDIDIEDDDDAVHADRIQVQQAVINLVRNAAEAVSSQPVRRVRLSGRRLDRARYQLCVEDNGPGVPEEQVDAIFRPLTTTKRTGMGLGLSVTRKIVEAHGGTLEVARSPLGGAAFRFTLPGDPAAEAAA
jgi:two-component system sensor kinase FixL